MAEAVKNSEGKIVLTMTQEEADWAMVCIGQYALGWLGEKEDLSIPGPYKALYHISPYGIAYDSGRDERNEKLLRWQKDLGEIRPNEYSKWKTRKHAEEKFVDSDEMEEV